jgi:hypothetical protein
MIFHSVSKGQDKDSNNFKITTCRTKTKRKASYYFRAGNFFTLFSIIFLSTDIRRSNFLISSAAGSSSGFMPLSAPFYAFE